MSRPIHVQILECLQTNDATGSMVDIKPFFEAELDTQEKRKAFKAELDFLVSEKLIETVGKHEYLGWELLTGLYPIENKKLEARLSGKWETYLASKREVKRDTPHETTFNYKPQTPDIYSPPETTIGYSKPGEKTVVTLGNTSSQPAAAKDKKEKATPTPLNTTEDAIPAEPVKAELPQNLVKRLFGAAFDTEDESILTSRKRTLVEPGPIAVKQQPAAQEAPEPPAPEPVPEPVAPAPRYRGLPSISDMPPGPVSMASIKSSYNRQLTSVADMPPGAVSIISPVKPHGSPVVSSVQATNATPPEQHEAAENNPFAPLELITLSPPKEQGFQWTTANILKWAVVIVGLILAIMVFKIWKARS